MKDYEVEIPFLLDEDAPWVAIFHRAFCTYRMSTTLMERRFCHRVLAKQWEAVEGSIERWSIHYQDALVEESQLLYTLDIGGDERQHLPFCHRRSQEKGESMQWTKHRKDIRWSFSGASGLYLTLLRFRGAADVLNLQIQVPNIAHVRVFGPSSLAYLTDPFARDLLEQRHWPVLFSDGKFILPDSLLAHAEEEPDRHQASCGSRRGTWRPWIFHTKDTFRDWAITRLEEGPYA